MITLCMLFTIFAFSVMPWFFRIFPRSFFMARAEQTRNQPLSYNLYGVAFRFDPLDPTLQFRIAALLLNQARILGDEAEKELQAGEKEKSSATALLMLSKYSAALAKLEVAEKNQRNHRVYYMRGRIYHDLYMKSPILTNAHFTNHKALGQMFRAKRFKDEAKANYRVSIDYSRADGDPLVSLIELYSTDRPQQKNLIDQFLGYVYDYAEEYWSGVYLNRVFEYMADGKYDQAYFMARDLLEVRPKDQDLQRILVGCLLDSGKIKAAEQYIEDMTKANMMDSGTRDYCLSGVHLQQKKWAALQQDCERVLENPDAFATPRIHQQERWRIQKYIIQVYYFMVLRKLEDPTADKVGAGFLKEWEEEAKKTIFSHSALIAESNLRFFDEPEKGASQVLDLVRRRTGEAFPTGLVPAIEYYLRIGKNEEAFEMFQYLRMVFKSAKDIPRLEQKFLKLDEEQKQNPARPNE